MPNFLDDLYDGLMNESDLFLDTGLTLDDEDGFYSDEDEEETDFTPEPLPTPEPEPEASNVPSFPKYKEPAQDPEPSEFGELYEPGFIEKQRNRLMTELEFVSRPFRKAGKKLSKDRETLAKSTKLALTRPDLILGFNDISNLPDWELQEVNDNVNKSMPDIIREQYPSIKESESIYVQFFAAEMGGFIAGEATDPLTYLSFYALERLIPSVAKGIFKKMPKSWQKQIVKQRYFWGQSPAAKAKKILGVKSNATEAEIKSAFRKLSVEMHPDKGGSKEAFQRMGEAYDILKTNSAADPAVMKFLESPASKETAKVKAKTFKDFFKSQKGSIINEPLPLENVPGLDLNVKATEEALKVGSTVAVKSGFGLPSEALDALSSVKAPKSSAHEATVAKTMKENVPSMFKSDKQIWDKSVDMLASKNNLIGKDGKPNIGAAVKISQNKIKKEASNVSGFDNLAGKGSPIKTIDTKINQIRGKRLSGSMNAQEATKQVIQAKADRLALAKEKGIAIVKTPKGAEQPVIRKSGVYAKESIAEAPVRDVYSQTMSPSNMALKQDGYQKGGEFGPVYKDLWMPTKRAVANNIETKKAFDTEFKDILKQNDFKITKKNGELLSDMLEKKIEIPAKYKPMVDKIRSYMDNKREMANVVRKKLGKTEIGYIEDYVPHAQQASVWSRLVGDDVAIEDNFDFIIPNQVKNPHAFQRFMEQVQKPERNFFTLVEDYNAAISKDIHINPAIENIKAHNAVLKSRGKHKASKFWDEYIRTGLIGKQHKLDSALSVSPKVRIGLKKYKDMLNKAFLTGKVAWNVATQPLSFISLTPTEAGFINTAKSVVKMFNKGIRNKVRQDSVSLRIKSGDIMGSAVGEGRDFANRIYRTTIDTWNDTLSMIGSIVEQFLHQVSYIAGLDKAKQLGYKGEDAKMFADLVAERSQSMYNKENRALMLNSDITTAAVPFQSFAVEMSNHLKEIVTKDAGGMGSTYRERFGKMIRLIVGTWMANQYSQAITGRKKTSVGTFIPFVGPMVDTLISKATSNRYTASRSPVSMVQQGEDLIKAAKDFIKHGSTTKLRKFAVNFIPALLGIGGGGQVNNIIDGIIADTNEEVKSASGKKQFDVKKPIDKIKAPIFGPWSTSGGRKYIEAIGKKGKTNKGAFSTISGSGDTDSIDTMFTK